jgi:hypothetical protein
MLLPPLPWPLCRLPRPTDPPPFRLFGSRTPHENPSAHVGRPLHDTIKNITKTCMDLPLPRLDGGPHFLLHGLYAIINVILTHPPTRLAALTTIIGMS